MKANRFVRQKPSWLELKVTYIHGTKKGDPPGEARPSLSSEYCYCGFPGSVRDSCKRRPGVENGSERSNPILPQIPACSTGAREYLISELPTRLSPSLPVLILSPVRVHHKAGARADVLFSPTIPPSAFAVHDFWSCCPLLTPHNSICLITIVDGELLKGHEQRGY